MIECECPKCTEDIVKEVTTVSNWIHCRRYIAAFLVYWVYWILLWPTATSVVGSTLSSDKATELVESGIIENITDYGWGDHYVWFVIFSLIVAFLCGALAGAMARSHFRLIPGLASILVAILYGIVAGLHYAGYLKVESPIAWGIAIPLAVVGSIVSSIYGGIAAEEEHPDTGENSRVYGIKSWHWAWLWLFASPYIVGVIVTAVRFIQFTWHDDGPSFFTFLWSLPLMVPLAAFICPMALMYRILSGDALEKESIVMKIAAFLGLYIGGLILAYCLEYVCVSLLQWIAG